MAYPDSCRHKYTFLPRQWRGHRLLCSVVRPPGAFRNSSDSPRVMSPERPAVTPGVKAQWKERFPDKWRRCSVLSATYCFSVKRRFSCEAPRPLAAEVCHADPYNVRPSKSEIARARSKRRRQRFVLECSSRELSGCLLQICLTKASWSLPCRLFGSSCPADSCRRDLSATIQR